VQLVDNLVGPFGVRREAALAVLRVADLVAKARGQEASFSKLSIM